MDQASALRHLMNGERVSKKGRSMNREKTENRIKTVAFLSLGDENYQSIMPTIFGLLGKEKSILMGVEHKKHFPSLSDYLSGKMAIEKTFYQMGDAEIVNGGFEEIDIDSEDKRNKLIEVVEKLEKEYKQLFYYTGNGLNAKTLNLSLSSQDIVVVLKPNAKGMEDLMNLVKILSYKGLNNQLYVLFDTDKKIIFKEQFNKLQEMSLRVFNYNIEPVGFSNLKFIKFLEDEEVGATLKLNQLAEKIEDSHFSKRLKEYI